jgi:hypothetical protein
MVSANYIHTCRSATGKKQVMVKGKHKRKEVAKEANKLLPDSPAMGTRSKKNAPPSPALSTRSKRRLSL